MTAEEKSLSLCKRIGITTMFSDDNDGMSLKLSTSKKIALIFVDEIIITLQECYYNLDDLDIGTAPKGCIDVQIDFYEQVKNELEKL